METDLKMLKIAITDMSVMSEESKKPNVRIGTSKQNMLFIISAFYATLAENKKRHDVTMRLLGSKRALLLDQGETERAKECDLKLTECENNYKKLETAMAAQARYICSIGNDFYYIGKCDCLSECSGCRMLLDDIDRIAQDLRFSS